MPATSLQETLAATGTLLIEPRIMRRVIRRHRRLARVGLEVPHGHCYTLPRADLLAIAGADDLGVPGDKIAERPILIPRPLVEPRGGKDGPIALRNYWRLTFHALVHQAYETHTLTPEVVAVEPAKGRSVGSPTESGGRLDGLGPSRGPQVPPKDLTPVREVEPAKQDRLKRALGLGAAMLRERIHKIGQAEFDEIRFVLGQDNLLLPPRGDVATWVEFAAVYLELRHFVPAQLERAFPTLHHLEAIDAILARDLDVNDLLAKSRPAGAPESPAAEALGEGTATPGALVRVPAADAALVGRAEPARARGNLVRAAVLAQRGGDAGSARRDVAALVARIRAAIPGLAAGADAWIDAIYPAVAWIAAQKTLRRTVEIRLLFDLQKAALAHEREISSVDPIAWALSLGKRKVVHALPAGREVRVGRQLEHARGKLGGLRLPEADRRRLGDLVHAAADSADDRVRAVLRPRLDEILDDVELRAGNVPERVARKKVVDELLDQIVARGFLSMGHMRDAISRNQLKLPDLSGPVELWRGDALLRADRRFGRDLEGVYRPAEIYLRVLQKLSSILFGTPVGRFLTLYLFLPVVLAYVSIEGVAHIVGPVGKLMLGAHIELFTLPRFAALIVLYFALLHSSAVRVALKSGLGAVWRFSRFVLVRGPLTIWRLFGVQRVFHSRPAALLGHYLVQPGLVGLFFFWLEESYFVLSKNASIGLGVGFFLAANLILNSRTGGTMKEIVGDWLVRGGREIGLSIVPGVFHLLVDFFKAVIEGIERGLYFVDELLRYRTGDSALSLWVKGTFGVAWSFVAYILRIYLNLFLEPTVNPLKHFPVVTVAAKIQLPLVPTLVVAVRTPLVPLIGSVAANSFAFFTVMVIPGAYGFLAWELRENWKLYRANRAPDLAAAHIGHHGETMGGYLKPAFHLGTIPKVYARLRRSAWRGSPSVNKFREALRHIADTLRNFTERELTELLAEASAWTQGPVTVGHLEVASNRVRIELLSAGRSAWLGFDEQSDLILAGIVEAGWIAELAADQREVLEVALAGFYKRAEVDLVREQIVAELTHAAPYDVADEGLVVWPDGKYQTEVVYALDPEAPSFYPVVRGPSLPSAPIPVNARQLMFSRQTLAWTAWVAAWSASIPSRVVDGPDLLGPA